MRDRAREFRREMTPAEKHLWAAIRYDQCDGLRFLRQRPMGAYVLDFYCAEKKLAVEVDGSIHLDPEVAENDRIRQEALESERGVRFLRLTNDEVLESSPAQLRQKIRRYLP
jgi:very-short-patch-repair endonuclease